MSEQADLALFYLARHAEGIKSFRRFIESYKAFPAGVAHKLVVIYKGFTQKSDLALAKAEFAGLPHTSVSVSDEHFDIGAYLQATAIVPSEYVCFVNTHTQVLCPNWLLYLRNAMDVSGVGMAGATCSFESLYDSLALNSKLVWLANNNYLSFDRSIADHYLFLLSVHAQGWLKGAKINRTRVLHRMYSNRTIDDAWNEYWRGLVKEGQVFDFIRGFPRFPNAHVRSNGFIIRRSLLLEFFQDLAPTKKAAYAFESGPNSLSARVVNRGLKLALVTRTGDVYFPEKMA